MERFMQYNIKMQKDKTRVRKCLSAMMVERNGVLVANDERKSYFFCLKMLDILPPPPKSDFKKWQYFTPALLSDTTGVRYVPKCLHDVLISSHATSCQHRTLYFAYYHRHLTMLFEIFLNLAHQILKGGQKVLNAVYPDHKDFYNQKNHLLWDKVFKDYAKLQKLPEQISGHYWNPTDYESDENLTIPYELDWSRNEESFESIDILYKDINGCPPWEINIKRRWYNTEEDYRKDISKGIEQSQIFRNYLRGYKNPFARYSHNEQQFLTGNINPRDNPLIFQKGNFYQQFLKKSRDIEGYSAYRSFLSSLSDDKGILRLNPITRDQSLTGYGSSSKKAQYISLADTKGFVTPQLRNDYNKSMPHYQFSHSIFDPRVNFKQFLLQPQQGFEKSHNIMHDHFGPILNDATFSITSLVFFPYHIWIDAQLQIKIRGANAVENKEDYHGIKKILINNYSRQLKGKLAGLFSQFETKANSSMDNVSKFQLTELTVNKKNAGYYPIVEWITPSSRGANSDISELSASFLSQDYILTKSQTIRDSLNLKEAYDKYFDYYKQRYSFLDDIKKVNPNFTFNPNFQTQLGSSLEHIEVILDQKATNIPEYLKKIGEDVKILAQVSSDAQEFIHKQKRSPPFVSFLALPSREAENIPSKEAEKSMPEQKQLTQQQLQIRKVLYSSIQLFASYPVHTPNGNHNIVAKPKQILQLVKELVEQKECSEIDLLQIQKYISDGINIGNISIFGKANFADVCPRCLDGKNIYLNLGQNLRNTSPKLWKFIHIKTLNETLYDSNKQVKINCIYQKLQLVPNQTFTKYRFIKGAEEIIINIIDKSKKGAKKFVRIDAESYSVEKDSLQSVLSKKYQSFTKPFDFFKIFDVNDDNNSNYFDQYVYQQLKGTFIVDNIVSQFSFKIPTFQRLLRLDIYVDTQQNENGKVTKVNISVKDRDYKDKKIFYEKSYEHVCSLFGK